MQRRSFINHEQSTKSEPEKVKVAKGVRNSRIQA